MKNVVHGITLASNLYTKKEKKQPVEEKNYGFEHPDISGGTRRARKMYNTQQSNSSCEKEEVKDYSNFYRKSSRPSGDRQTYKEDVVMQEPKRLKRTSDFEKVKPDVTTVGFMSDEQEEKP
jgi:hypothetical protein